MFPILLLLLAVLASVAAIIIKKKKGTAEILETILLFMLFFNVGIGGLIAFAGHAFRADQVAARIGWPAGSPFQFEVAVANLAIGVIGILSVWFRRDFWLAASIVYMVFLFGAAAGHINEMLLKGNYSEYNTGAFLFAGDIAIPLTLFILVLINRKLRSRGNSAEPEKP